MNEFDIELTSSGYIKFLSDPELVYGYFTGKYKSLTTKQAKNIVQKKMNALYDAVCDDWYGGEIELTFYDKQSYEWWNTLLENTKSVPEYKIEGYKGSYNYKEIPTGNWLIDIPKPPKYIFEIA